MKYTLLALCLGFVVSLLISPLVISLMKKLKGEQSILEYVDMHEHKKGTPTMGGVIFVIGLIIFFSTDKWLQPSIYACSLFDDRVCYFGLFR